jgi:4a-hydroxytetrahydrobiopterin dehydratase
MATLLAADIITGALKNLPEWTGDTDRLSRTVTLTDEQHAEVQRQVMISADAMDHHPDISRSGQQTVFVLSTHSAGGVTSYDIALASEISTRIRAVLGQAPPPLPEQVLASDAVTEARNEGHEGHSAAGEHKPTEDFIGVPAGAQGTSQVPLPDTAPGEPEPGMAAEQEPR